MEFQHKPPRPLSTHGHQPTEVWKLLAWSGGASLTCTGWDMCKENIQPSGNHVLSWFLFIKQSELQFRICFCKWFCKAMLPVSKFVSSEDTLTCLFIQYCHRERREQDKFISTQIWACEAYVAVSVHVSSRGSRTPCRPVHTALGRPPWGPLDPSSRGEISSHKGSWIG